MRVRILGYLGKKKSITCSSYGELKDIICGSEDVFGKLSNTAFIKAVKCLRKDKKIQINEVRIQNGLCDSEKRITLTLIKRKNDEDESNSDDKDFDIIQSEMYLAFFAKLKNDRVTFTDFEKFEDIVLSKVNNKSKELLWENLMAAIRDRYISKIDINDKGKMLIFLTKQGVHHCKKEYEWRHIEERGIL